MQNKIINTQYTKAVKGNTIIIKRTIVTTNKAVIVYDNNQYVGSASVIRVKDFDYEALLNIALHKSGVNYDWI